MSDRTREILRNLYDDDTVYKVVGFVLVFGNIALLLALWRWLAPEAVEGYQIVAVLVGGIAGVAEGMLLSWYLFPERSLSATMKGILAVGAVAAIGLSVWTGSQLNARYAPQPASAMTPQERVDVRKQEEQGRAAIEQFQQIQATRAAERQKAGGATRPAR